MGDRMAVQMLMLMLMLMRVTGGGILLFCFGGRRSMMIGVPRMYLGVCKY